MKRKSLLVAVLLFLLLACSKEEDADSRYGGSLVYASRGDAKTFDPALSSDSEGTFVLRQIYERLVDFDREKREIVPVLAESWQLSDDGLTLTMTLRQGVRFHDGTQFDAYAAAYSLNRQHDPQHDFYNTNVWRNWTSQNLDEAIRTIRARDEYTLEISLNYIYTPLLFNLTRIYASIISPSALEKNNGRIEAVSAGTAAFKLYKWNPGSELQLLRFEQYWGEPAFLDEVFIRVIPDQTTRLNALKAGEIDVLYPPPPEALEELKNNPDLKLEFFPGSNVGYISLNIRKYPFHRKEIRQALNYAVDRDIIVETAYEGLGAVAKNPVPPIADFYKEDTQGYTYNPEKARQLLAEAGFPDGFHTELWVMPISRRYMPNPKAVGHLVQKQLAQVGIISTIVSYEWAEYLDRMDKGEHPMALIGWSTIPRADNFMYPLFTENPLNASGWYDPRVLDLLNTARQTMDSEIQRKSYYEVQEIFIEEAPWINLAHTQDCYVMQPYVMGINPPKEFTLKDLWLDKNE